MDPERKPDGSPDRAVWGAAAAGVVATYLAQLSTAAVKLAARDAGYLGGRCPGGDELTQLLLGCLGPPEWTGVVLGVAAVLALVALEVRGRRVSRAVRLALESPRAAWPLLAVVGALAVRSYFDPGIPHQFDAKQHYAKIVAASRMLADGEWPTWTWRWYGGFPLLRFYPPLLYLTAGGLGTLVGPEAGTKIVLVAIHLGSGWTLFRFVKAWSGSHRASVVAAVAYLLASQRFHTLLDIGRLPEAPLYLLFPWLLYHVERFAAGGTARLGLRAGAVLAAMVLCHPMLGAVGGVLGGIYALLRLAACGRLRRAPWETAQFAALTGAFAFLLAAFWLGPATELRPHVLLGRMYGAGPGALVPLALDARNVGNLFARSGPGEVGATLAYAGWVVTALSAVALWRYARRDAARVLPVAGMIVVGLVYACGGYFLARSVVFLPAFLAAAAGLAVTGLPEPAGVRPAWLRPLGLAGLAVAAVVADFLPGSVRSPFRPDLRPLQDAFHRLAAHTHATKAVVASRRGGRIDLSQWTGWDDSSLMVLGGPFREGATRVFGWNMAALARVEADLRDGGRLEPGTIDRLRLLGVEWVVVEDGVGFVDPGVGPGAGYTLEPALPGVRIDGARAVFLARRGHAAAALGEVPVIFDLPRDPADRAAWDRAWDDLLASTGDGRDGVLDSFPLPPGRGPIEGLGPPAGRIEVTREGHRRLSLAVALDRDAFAVLPFATFPGCRARAHRDGGEDLPLVETAPGFLALRLPAGTYRVTLGGPHGPPTGVWLFVSFVGWAVWVWQARLRRATLSAATSDT